MKKAILFPGQGTQYPGMGQSFYENKASFKKMVDTADESLPYDLKAIMFESEEVHRTRYAQPALYVMGCALYEMFKEEGIAFDIAAGLSIGEYPALYAQGAFDFLTGLDIVEHRAHYMQMAADQQDTVMLAVRTDFETAERLTGNVKDAHISNYNLENQVVLAGSKKAMDTIRSEGKTMNVGRMVPLNTSAAFHTPFMETARAAFEAYLETIVFHEPEEGLYLNQTGSAYEGGLKERMIDQMTHTVLFAPMLKKMLDDGLGMTFEAGPGKTLSTFVRKTDRTVHTLTTEENIAFETICEKIRSEEHA